jgi:L-asparaginase II
VHALPLYNASSGYARLSDPRWPARRARRSLPLITRAMRAHRIWCRPDRLDTHLWRAAHGKLFSKMGAEGFRAVGVLLSHSRPPALGIHIKIAMATAMGARAMWLPLKSCASSSDRSSVEGLEPFWD